MCGILAWIDPAGHQAHAERLTRATQRMAHRGPDGTGLHVSGPVALGHRRLSVIDAAGGGQPMLWDGGRLALVYNGEIYNHAEVAAELRGLGVRLATRSDTEVILAAYDTWGPDCLRKFNGMFAFALWDERRQTLWVARDRLGIKPLYYWSGPQGFACASEIGPLLELGLLRPELNARALDAYFTLGYVPAPKTMFAGIRKLEPGHYLTYADGALRDVEYWDFADLEPTPCSDEEALEKFAPLLRDAVRCCLVSDVPLGTFLSGGLDSSAVVALMAECGVDPVNTFTAGFSRGGEGTEEGFARLIAARYQCRHFVHDLPPRDFLDSLETLVRHTEEPVVEPSGVALHALARVARREATVLLSGEGSDEVLGGYGIYRRMLQLERWHRRLPLPGTTTPTWLGRLAGSQLTKYNEWLRLPLERRFRGTSALLTDGLRHQLYAPDFLAQAGSYLEDTFDRHFRRTAHHADPLSRLLYVDTKTWLADDLLIKADQMTMAASVELRVPFLDHRLVELAATLPAGLKIRKHEGKWILRRAMEGKVPNEILHRRKMGFPVPLDQWFGKELRPALRERLLDSQALPWLNRKAIEHLIESPGRKTENRTRLLMTLLVLESWQRVFC